jgi:hypothetical protein
MVIAVAPASAASVKVRMPAAARCGPSPLRRSRSAPISRPMPSAAANPTTSGSKPCELKPGRSGMVRPSGMAARA